MHMQIKEKVDTKMIYGLSYQPVNQDNYIYNQFTCANEWKTTAGWLRTPTIVSRGFAPICSYTYRLFCIINMHVHAAKI